MAAETRENMDKNDFNNGLLKLSKYITRNSYDCHPDILEIKHKKFEINFQVKNLNTMSVVKYQCLVEALQKRFGLNEEAIESFLDSKTLWQ